MTLLGRIWSRARGVKAFVVSGGDENANILAVVNVDEDGVPVGGASVVVTGVPADPFGVNADASVAAGAAGSMQAKLRRLTADMDALKTSLQIMDDWDTNDRAKTSPIPGIDGVRSGSGNVDGGTQRVVLAADVPLPQGTNQIGKLAANNGVDIGDVDVQSQPARDRLVDNMGVALQTDKIMDDETPLTPKFAVIDENTVGPNQLVAGVTSPSNKKIRVLAYVMVGADAAAMVATFQDDAGSPVKLTGPMTLAAEGGGGCAPFNPLGWFETTAGDDLDLLLGGAYQVSGHITYVEID